MMKNMEALRSIPSAEGYEWDIELETLVLLRGAGPSETEWQKEVHFVRIPMKEWAWWEHSGQAASKTESDLNFMFS